MKRSMAMALALLACAGPAAAQQAPKDANATRPAESFTAVAPVFGQLVMLTYPAGFTVPFEATNQKRYLREAIPEGQTVERWTEMITLTGAKGLAGSPHVSPPAVAERLAEGFSQKCPATHAAKPLGATKFDGHDAFLAIASCGSVKGPVGEHSEAALIVVIKGAADYYTIQWAERGPPSAKPLADDDAKWMDRYKRLGPIRLCPIMQGEAAPYPSCTSPKG